MRVNDAGQLQRTLRRLGVALIIVSALSGQAGAAPDPVPPPAPAPGGLDVTVEGLRSNKGLVRVCVTRSADHFPQCDGDPAARRLSVPAAQAAHLHLDGLAPGGWALALIHDENGNGRLDTRLGIPREGFGFSRNPKIGFGPPGFTAARFDLPAAGAAQTVRVKYML